MIKSRAESCTILKMQGLSPLCARSTTSYYFFHLHEFMEKSLKTVPLHP
jgi:hypothetical protein